MRLLTQLFRFAQQEEISQNQSNKTFWDRLSDPFKNFLKTRSNIKDVEIRLKRPIGHPKLEKLKQEIEDLLIRRLQKIQRKYPNLVNTFNEISEDVFSNDDEMQFVLRETTWPSGSGQNFMKGEDEKVIAVHLSKDQVSRFAKDPDLKEFLAEKSGHFQSVTAPLGWALVYIPKDRSFAVINQIQSDILPQYKRYLEEKEVIERKSITEEEVRHRLIANGRRNLANNEQLVRYLANHPEQIEDIPSNIDPDDWIQQQAFQNQNREETSPMNDKDRKGRISSKIRTLVEEWPHVVYEAVKRVLKREGINTLYMNTSKTVDQSSREKKREYFYESLPQQWRFDREKVNVGRGPEELWHTKLARLQKATLKLRKIITRRRNFKTDRRSKCHLKSLKSL